MNRDTPSPPGPTIPSRPRTPLQMQILACDSLPKMPQASAWPLPLGVGPLVTFSASPTHP